MSAQKHTQTSENQTLTLTQAAQILDVNMATVRRWTNNGKLPSFRTPGGHRRLHQADVEKIALQKQRRQLLKQQALADAIQIQQLALPKTPLKPISSLLTEPSLKVIDSDPLNIPQAEGPRGIPLGIDNKSKSSFRSFLTLALILATLLVSFKGVKAFRDTIAYETLYNTLPFLSRFTGSPLSPLTQNKITDKLKGSVLQATDTVEELIFEVNIPTNIDNDLNVSGDLTVDGDLITNGNVAFDSISADTADFGSADITTLSIGGTTLTSTATELNYLDGLTLAAGGIAYSTSTGLQISAAGTSSQVLTSNGSGAPTWKSVSSIQSTDASTLDSLDSTAFLRSNADDTYDSGNTLTVAGALAVSGSLTSTGDVSISDTNIALNGATTTFTTTGDLTLAVGGSDILSTSRMTLGSATAGTAQLLIDGNADVIQLQIQGHSTQTASTFVIEQSDGTDVLAVGNTGVLTLTNSGTTNTTFNLSSSGDFIIQDNGTAFITFNSSGQVVGSDTLLFNLSAATHNSTTPEGIILPQATSFTSPSSGEGYIAWDSDDNKLMMYTGSAWVDVAAAGGSLWTDGGTTTYLTATTDDLAVGGTDSESNLFFDESASALSLNPYGTSAGNTGELRFEELEANGDSYTGFKSPDSLAANVVYTLPSADATTSNQVLASSAAGVLSWIDVSAGAGTLWTDGGTTTYVTSTTDDIAMGGTTAESPFWMDVSASLLNLNPYGTSTGNTGAFVSQELEANGDSYTGFKAPDSLAASVVYALPLADASSANQVLSSNASGTLAWIDVTGGAGAPWTTSTTNTYLTTTTNDVIVGASTPVSSAKLSVDGDDDQIQLVVQGNATQTVATQLFLVETSAGSDLFSVDVNGDLVLSGELDINGTGTHDIAGTLNLSGTTLTASGDLTITPVGGDVILGSSVALTASKINKVIVVDGTTYAQTCAGINAAIDALGASGGEIYLPEATYTCTETITVDYNNTTIRGAGKGSKIVASAWGSWGTPGDVITTGTTDYNSFRDFQIDGTLLTAQAYDLLDLPNGSNYIVIDGLYLKNSDRYGININPGGAFVMITNSIIEGSDSYGIVADNTSAYTNIANNIIRTNDYGIVIAGDFVDVSNNIITGNTTAGISATGWGEDATITGNTFFSNGTYGVYVSGTGFDTNNNVTISGNEFKTHTNGVYLNNTKQVAVVGNNIFQYSTQAGQYGVYITGASADPANSNLISNNVITGYTDAGDIGIYIVNSYANNNILSYNSFSTNETNITDNGVNTQISNADSGNLSIGGADSTPDTTLELFRASGSDSTFSMTDGDVAHGVTTLANTDAFFHAGPISSTVGGTRLTSLADADGQALELRAVQTAPTDTTPAIKLVGAKASGTGVVDLDAAETVFQVANNDDAAALTVLGSGSVGIGDTTPDAVFDVDSTSATAVIFGDGTSNYFTFDGSTDVGDTLFTFTGASSGITSGKILSVVADTITTGNALDFSVDGISTGNGMYLESTSTALSSGNIASYYWNPGSATTATGDILRLDVGSNGTIGNILNVMNGGSSVFSVSQSQITSALPHQFTAAGDVSIAYDLQFTNQTASYIKSYAPLYIEAGETFENNDLTLRTYGTGDVILDFTTSTGTGKLQIAAPDPSIVFDTETATDTDFWMGVVEDAGADDDDTFQIGDGTTPGTNPWLVLDTSGNVGIGPDTTPDYKFEINVAASSDSTFALVDGDVAHGVTTLVNTDAFFHAGPISSTVGGTRLTSLADADGQAFEISAVQTAPTDTTPAIKLVGAKASGTGVVDLDAAETVFQVANNNDTAGITMLGDSSVGIGTVTPSSFANKLAVIYSVSGITGGTSGTFQNTFTPTANTAGSPIALKAATTVSGGSTNYSSANTAIRAQASNVNNTGSLTTTYGVYSQHGALSGGTTGSSAASYGVYSDTAWSSSATLASAYNYAAVISANSGTFTNTYGFYAGDLTSGTQSNTPFSFYASDTGTFNYFGGRTGIGDTSPLGMLEVSSASVDTYGKALAIFNHDETEDLLTASASSVTKFAVSSTGALYVGDNTTLGTSTALCWESVTRNGATVYQVGDCTGTPGDYAEMYPVENDITYGDVVTLGTENVVQTDGQIVKRLVKSSREYDSSVVGIVSNNYHDFTLAGSASLNSSDNPMPVALSGRVPVKVSTSSAEIQAGDFLTTSTEAGKAMKATVSGYVIGKALEDWSPGQTTVMVFVNNTYYSGIALNEQGQTGVTANSDTEGTIPSDEQVLAKDLQDNQYASQSAALKQEIDTLSSKVTELTTNLDSLTSLVLSASDSALVNPESYILNLNDETATVSSLMVTDKLLTQDLGITGSLTSGLLTINGLNGDIHTLAGPLRLQSSPLASLTEGIEILNGYLTIDTKGNLNINQGHIKGNDTFRGSITLPTGKIKVTVPQEWETVPTSITLTPSYLTVTAITNITTDGFTIEVLTPSLKTEKIYWTAIW